MIKTLVEIILIYIDFELLSINVVRQNKRAVAESLLVRMQQAELSQLLVYCTLHCTVKTEQSELLLNFITSTSFTRLWSHTRNICVSPKLII